MEDKKKKLECSDEENPICLTGNFVSTIFKDQ